MKAQVDFPLLVSRNRGQLEETETAVKKIINVRSLEYDDGFSFRKVIPKD